MKVSALIALAKATVLKQLTVPEADVLSFVNLALLQVYKKFPINIKEQNLVLQETIHIYDLNPDVMQVVSVYTLEKYLRNPDGSSTSCSSDTVVELSVNDESDVNSFFTPTPGTGMITHPTTGQILSVLYRAGSVDIEADELESDLKVTPQYIEPLLMYIGYLGYLTLNSSTAVDDKFLIRFEVACASLKKTGMVNSEGSTNLRLDTAGYP